MCKGIFCYNLFFFFAHWACGEVLLILRIDFPWRKIKSENIRRIYSFYLGKQFFMNFFSNI